jgi:Ribonuclease G/E
MSMIDGLILAGGPGERRIAQIEGDTILGFQIDRFQAAAGDIFRGRMLARPAGLTAAFIEIGDEQPAFLARPGKLQEGEAILVQVTSAARRGKGASVSARPSLSGSWLVYGPYLRGVALSRHLADSAAGERLRGMLAPLLGDGEGIVLRSAAPQADETELLAELDSLRRQWREIAQHNGPAPAKLLAPGALARLARQEAGLVRLLVDDPALLPEAKACFPAAEYRAGVWRDSGAADCLEQALAREVALPQGGRLIIDETAGATVIDVDGGGLTPESANRAALREIVRQMRLRSMAGHILIDVIPMGGKTAMDSVIDALRALLAGDPVGTQVIGATRLGMLELTRERQQPSLAEWFLRDIEPRRSAASLALEALQAVLREAMHRAAWRPCLVAAPAIIRYLDSRPDLLQETATRLGRPLTLVARDAIEGFEVTDVP